MSLRDHAPAPRRRKAGTGSLQQILVDRTRGVGKSLKQVQEAQYQQHRRDIRNRPRTPR